MNHEIKPCADKWCVHFNGVQHKRCEAGVDYDSLTEPLPCVRSMGESNQCCAKRQWPTPDQIAAAEEETEELISRMKKVGPIIIKVKNEHKGSNWSGTDKCPICGGVLHLTHAKYNGHVHGRCDTKDCLWWME